MSAITTFGFGMLLGVLAVARFLPADGKQFAAYVVCVASVVALIGTLTR